MEEPGNYISLTCFDGSIESETGPLRLGALDWWFGALDEQAGNLNEKPPLPTTSEKSLGNMLDLDGFPNGVIVDRFQPRSQRFIQYGREKPKLMGTEDSTTYSVHYVVIGCDWWPHVMTLSALSGCLNLELKQHQFRVTNEKGSEGVFLFDCLPLPTQMWGFAGPSRLGVPQ